MAVIIIENDDGEEFGRLEVDGRRGPWTDDWQHIGRYEFAEIVGRAVRSEGGE